MPYVLKWDSRLLLSRSALISSHVSGLKGLILFKNYLGFRSSWHNRAEGLGLHSEQVKRSPYEMLIIVYQYCSYMDCPGLGNLAVSIQMPSADVLW